MTHPQHLVNRMIAALKTIQSETGADIAEIDRLLGEIAENPIYVADPDKDKYNGWANYETWLVNLWLTNDESSDTLVDELITDPDGSPSDTYELSKRLRDYVEELNPLADESSMFSDLVGAALSSCKWYEIAENWMTDYIANNPPKGVKNNPMEYDITPDWIDSNNLNDPTTWSVSDDHNDVYGESLPLNFWEAFNTCIQDAMDSGYTSIVINWNIQEGDVRRYAERKAALLVQQQHERNTKDETMRTVTLRKAIWDVNLAVFIDRDDNPITKKWGGNTANGRISVASIIRLERLLQDKTPISVEFGSVGLIVRYSFPKIKGQ